MKKCTVYIDEAGDFGVNRGTQWFVLSGVIIDKTDEIQLRRNISQIKSRINLHEIHMRNIGDFNKRAFIVRALNDENFTYMNIVVDTNKFDSSRIPSTTIAYNYVCKYLLQRASRFMEDTGRVGDIVLSARGTARDGELIQYIKDKLLPYPDNKINATVFDTVSAKTAASWDMLQLADVCATTTFWNYEVNGFGFCVPCFSLALQSHLYRYNGTVESYGIKFFTNDMKPNMTELRTKRICAEKERTPGATTT